MGLNKKLSKAWLKVLAKLFNISKSEVRRVWIQGGFHFLNGEDKTIIRKGKRHFRKIVWVNDRAKFEK